MKNLISIISALLFSILFYGKSIGLNLSLFSVLIISALFIQHKKTFKQKSTVAYAILYLLTAFAVFIYNNSLSIIANTIALITLVGQISTPNASLYINWLNGLYSTISGLFHRHFNTIEKEEKKVLNKNIDYLHLFKIISVPIVAIVLFICLYKDGNPVFNNLINHIDFSFINLQWILLAVLGYYLIDNISKPIAVNPATTIDAETGNLLFKEEQKQEQANLIKEHQFGFILILALNVLIILFLITDFTYLTTSTDFRAPSFSNQVHSSIYTLIASIIIAIIIILYFFRGELNFYKKNKGLKVVAFAWISLNAILIINIAIKDFQYIYYFGLTYKRIGVLVYLLLTIIGLTTTYIKIKNINNLWYLFRINTLTAFTILIVSCTINWDSFITIYNLNYSKSMDFKYLIKLSNNNTFILKNYLDKKSLNQKQTRAINRKYKRYLKTLSKNTWQEIHFDNLKIK